MTTSAIVILNLTYILIKTKIDSQLLTFKKKYNLIFYDQLLLKM